MNDEERLPVPHSAQGSEDHLPDIAKMVPVLGRTENLDIGANETIQKLDGTIRENITPGENVREAQDKKRKQEPWLASWVAEKELPKGGQGTTFLVRAKDRDFRGVLKVLRNQHSDQARRRMYREVANLKVLANAGCKVPAVLESNTDEFESKNARLYFVMEYIPGDSLADIVSKSKGLALEQASTIVLDVCATVDRAAKEQVLHRDLKPENIIVRSMNPADCVIVDYGLSFNQADSDTLTRVGEALDNKFLSLPERRVPGGDRRDLRSDLTGVCGLLYFCITGEAPVDLADANGRPPHHRQGRSIQEKLAGDPRTGQLEVFFDRGFSTIIDTRYQSVTELVDRLNSVLFPAARRPTEDPLQFAKRSADIILRHDRKTQLARYQENSEGIIKILNGVLSAYSTGKNAKELLPYLIGLLSRRIDNRGRPDDVEDLGVGFSAQVRIQHNPQVVAIAYQIYVRGSQCAVFRRSFRLQTDASKHTPPKQTWDPIGKWEAILWYDGLSSPNAAVVGVDFKAWIVDAMQMIEREIVQ